MKFAVLGSGSQGNSVYIESGRTGLLIDNGFSGKELANRLAQIGRSIDNISAVCITHEHNDHVAGVGVISRRVKVPVYGNMGTFRGAEKKMGKLCARMEFETGDKVAIGDLEIHSFPVSHDSRDPVGFVVSDGHRYLGCCTDTGMVTKLMALRLGGCHGLVLEFNHNLEMLKNGPYPLALQQRVRSNQGHLSNEDGAALLASLLHPALKYGVLAHLSETNNRPELALAAAVSLLGRETPTELLLASQHRSTSLFSL